MDFSFFEDYWNGSCGWLKDFFYCRYNNGDEFCTCSWESNAILFRLILFFYFIFYISIFWIIDLIRFLINSCKNENFSCKNNCCCKYEFHLNAGKGEQIIYLSNSSTIKEIIANSKIKNLEATEQFWTEGYNKSLFMCSQCYYNPNTFIDFIKNDNYISVNISKNFAINITTMNNKINCPITCNPNDLFKIVIDKFYKLYPDYQNKECIFLASGQKLDPNLSLSKNGVINGVNIILKINDDENSEVSSISYNK